MPWYDPIGGAALAHAETAHIHGIGPPAGAPAMALRLYTATARTVLPASSTLPNGDDDGVDPLHVGKRID
jgi:hypothetical protein